MRPAAIEVQPSKTATVKTDKTHTAALSYASSCRSTPSKREIIVAVGTVTRPRCVYERTARSHDRCPACRTRRRPVCTTRLQKTRGSAISPWRYTQSVGSMSANQHSRGGKEDPTKICIALVVEHDAIEFVVAIAAAKWLWAVTRSPPPGWAMSGESPPLIPLTMAVRQRRMQSSHLLRQPPPAARAGPREKTTLLAA